jgi:deazaflavin-dependent oxidoreductase (nitroreductase family)
MSDSGGRSDFLRKLKGSGEVTISVNGRKTGKKLSTPVWFLLDEEKNRVIIVPVSGSKTNWFKNLERNPQIELASDVASTRATATIVRDADQAKRIVEKLKQKYRPEWSESYYKPRDVHIEVPV